MIVKAIYLTDYYFSMVSLDGYTIYKKSISQIK